MLPSFWPRPRWARPVGVVVLLLIGWAADRARADVHASSSDLAADTRNRLAKVEGALSGQGKATAASGGFPFSRGGRLTCYSCEAPHCHDRESVRLCHNALRCYIAHVRDVHGVEHQSKGCTRDLPQTSFYCTVASYDGRHTHRENRRSAQYAIECCRESLCNNQTVWPPLPPVPVVVDPDPTSDTSVTGGLDGGGGRRHNDALRWAMVVLCPMVVLGLSGLFVYGLIRRRHQKRMARCAQQFPMANAGLLVSPDGGDHLAIGGHGGLRAQPVGDSTLREFRGPDEDSTSGSGSGSGQQWLVQRTLAKQIQIKSSIGTGKYGKVMLGVWKGDNVAVKIFSSRDEKSWQNEKDIYSTALLRHDNILGYIGSDFTSFNQDPQLWLVTQYHPNGSLYDFLNQPFVLYPARAHIMILSALNGIVHLHTEIRGEQAKPGIAHRDIKSKNILVREDGQCVIADFGLAVTQTGDVLTVPNNPKVGTKRYMSPEVLDGSIVHKSTFDAYRCSDMYSFALVMWEMLHRTNTKDLRVDLHALPYHSDVADDPNFEEMRIVVCDRQVRPIIEERWKDDRLLHSMSRLMSECWHSNASARLSSLRLRKSLESLQSKLDRPTSRFSTPSQSGTTSGTFS